MRTYSARRSPSTPQFASEQGSLLIPPMMIRDDEPLIVAGQGSCGLELLEQVPTLHTLVVSGGGLLSGCGLAGKALKPTLCLYGVEPEISID
ncbi:MAG: pyridoxal-phosphate dependent enzyme [Cyanobacteriota bacterium]